MVAIVGLLGILAEWVGYGIDRPRSWAPDLLAGLVVAGAGGVAWARRPESRTGLLLVVTAACWFVGALAPAVIRATGEFPLVAQTLPAVLVALHRAPFAQALLAYPGGRLVTNVERVATAIAYASVALAAACQFGPVASLLALVVVAATFAGYRRSTGRLRTAKLLAFRIGLVVAAAVLASPVLRAIVGPAAASETSIVLYEIALGVSATVLAYAIVATGAERAAATDIVVDLGDGRSDGVRDALAELLGDDSLQIGYRVAGRAGYVDGEGRPLLVDRRDPGTATTRIERDGTEVAVLVHDPSVLDEPALIDAVTSAATLASRNAELQAEVHDRVDELQASRRRLVDAADDERQRLAQRLSETTLARLDRLGDRLDAAGVDIETASESGELLARARTQLRRTAEDLRALADGLHPAELESGGLALALHGLTERSPFRVEMDVDDIRLPPDVEAALYYVCAEGLANVAKHARAKLVRLSVRSTGERVALDLSDDGVGGADPAAGTGLRGLADRLDALGGRFSVSTAPGAGTRLVAELPLGGPTSSG